MQKLGKTDLLVPEIALGCMRMDRLTTAEAAQVLGTALDLGMNFFDHADIYGRGASEERFTAARKELGLARDQLLLQSKCGIHDGVFDFSKDHILASVDGILRRLDTDYLDVLALHRPDALMEAEEVAEAFRILYQAGKVRHFGVSNQNIYQMELLQSYMDQPLVVNQLQLSPAHTPLIDAGLHVNMREESGIMRDGGLIDYCQLKKITIQAWSPFLIDLHHGIFAGHPDYAELNATLDRYAQEYGVATEAIVIAWIMRHPAKIQTIVGSMNPDRIKRIAQAQSVRLDRMAWYDIYKSAGNILP